MSCSTSAGSSAARVSMNAEPNCGGSGLPAEMALLLFHAAGVALGVEAAAVEGILDEEQARSAGIACRDLAEILGAGGALMRNARLFLNCREAPCAIGIDHLDEIITVPTTALQPLPESLPQFRGLRAFWGGIVRANRVVLLVDVGRLLEPPTAIGYSLR